MADFCWTCTEDPIGVGAPGERNGLAGWLADLPATEGWASCEGCGRHLFDEAGRKVCGLGPDATGWGDEHLGCGHCHAWRREQNRVHVEGRVAPQRNQVRWRDWEQDYIKRMNRQGKTLAEIADALHRTPKSVATRLVTLGEPGHRRKALSYRSRDDLWTPAEIATMLELIARGWSNPQIAAFLGRRSAAAINRKLGKIGKSDARGEPECRWCGEPLVHDRSRKGRKRKYCDPACANAWYRRNRTRPGR